ncbi:MAG: DNA methyltransferase [Armatimonadota bacterium]|nr:DNA methyltransferase [Armatimonadota bacterium]
MSGHHVLCGDSASLLGHFPDNWFDCIVTDPPHALFFMGADWDRNLPEQHIWEECLRVLKPGGHAWVMSSERVGCVAGLYMSLRKAGFVVDETQLLLWVSLTGMPKSVDVAKTADKQAFRAWLDYVGAALTDAERRKAASAAVGGVYSGIDDNVDRGQYVGHGHGGDGPNEREWTRAGKRGRDAGTALLSRLLSLHWPSYPAARREHWEAVVPDVPDDWDCSRPPGVRIACGQKKFNPRDKTSYTRNVEKGWSGAWQEDDGSEQPYVTAPSTPAAVEWDGWRGSTAPLKPFAYPILHAVKAREGSYLDNAEKWGVGPLNVQAAKIPFVDAPRPRAHHKYESGEGGWMTTSREDVSSERGEGEYCADPAGRSPSNLLSYGDLLGDLQRYADLDAWCEALGLPEAAAELLETGLVYCPKPRRAEKEAGLEEFSERPAGGMVGNSPNHDSVDRLAGDGKTPVKRVYSRNTHSTVKPVALCAYLIALSTRSGQTVLDPFLGSGSTGVAAALLDRKFVGIELDAEDKGYCEIARARIAHAQESLQPTLQAVMAGG